MLYFLHFPLIKYVQKRAPILHYYIQVLDKQKL